jgi:hypothetical protein
MAGRRRCRHSNRGGPDQQAAPGYFGFASVSHEFPSLAELRSTERRHHANADQAFAVPRRSMSQFFLKTSRATATAVTALGQPA